MRLQKLENANRALSEMQKDGLRLVAVGPEDIVDGNEKLLLGLLWSIIMKFEICVNEFEEGLSSREGLLQWVSARLEGRSVRNFSSDWKDAATWTTFAECVGVLGAFDGDAKSVVLSVVHAVNKQVGPGFQ